MGPDYNPTIIEHFRRPRNYGELEDADAVQEVYNPLCGDRIRLALRFDGDGIAAARFTGDCCAISMAAASLLTLMITGRAILEAVALPDDALLAALDAEIRPARLACALLPLRALRQAIAERDRTG